MFFFFNKTNITDLDLSVSLKTDARNFIEKISKMVRVKSGPRTAQQQAVARGLHLRLETKRQNSPQSTQNSSTLVSSGSSTSVSSAPDADDIKIVPNESKRLSDIVLSDEESDSDAENSKLCEYTDKNGHIRKRCRPGVRALREIRHFQNQTSTTIPRATFSRVVREILEDQRKKLKLTAGALFAIQASPDFFFVSFSNELFTSRKQQNATASTCSRIPT